jgi:glycerol-3-phosphate acyltransferase PlsY
VSGWVGGAFFIASYLLGSISFSFLVVRRLRGADVRQLGSGNAGATNVLRTTGAPAALAVLLLDVAKGFVPVALCRLLDLPPWLQAAAGCAAVAGHVFPLYHGFRGGKGVATAAGALAGLAAGALIVGAGIFAIVVLATRLVSLGSMLGTVAVPVAWWWGGTLGWWPAPTPGGLTWIVVMAAIVLFRHRANLERLLRGEERRLDFGRESKR